MFFVQANCSVNDLSEVMNNDTQPYTVTCHD
ncbi:hypothetical protein CPS_2515 [Colwellia psychrerythraea 34H]|uniref:Uncharacterized protein n=1 Tax=Colwellia psychrerythraea (strain 34H / ATCC BAA-681) TaxID=167879 RepID=Q481N8_COLP3|nr:hypothetical protein CPS_2515 [Colwellia psychrerythraea 34H]